MTVQWHSTYESLETIFPSATIPPIRSLSIQLRIYEGRFGETRWSTRPYRRKCESQCAVELLRYAHQLVHELVHELLSNGARLVVGVGKEPLVDDHDPTSPSIVFDWTVLEAAATKSIRGSTPPRGPQGPVIATVATDKTENQIPAERKLLWDSLVARNAVQLEFTTPGWTSGAIKRIRQSQNSVIFSSP